MTENQTTVTMGYTFDAYNNRVTKTIGASTVAAYTYDANDRMLTETTGEGTKNYTYDNNGNQLTTTIGANPFRYCGEYFDKETETYYLRARHYYPSTGRFTQQDPISNGLNFYVYCNNNPIMFIDPSGLFTQEQYDYYQLNWSSWYLDSTLDSYMNDSNNLGIDDPDWFIVAWDTWMNNNFSEENLTKKSVWFLYKHLTDEGKLDMAPCDFALSLGIDDWVLFFPGFQWDFQGQLFHVNTHQYFNLRFFCLDFANEVIRMKGLDYFGGLSAEDIAAECFAHAVILGFSEPLIGYWQRASDLYDSAIAIDISPNDNRIPRFRQIWQFFSVEYFYNKEILDLFLNE